MGCVAARDVRHGADFPTQTVAGAAHRTGHRAIPILTYAPLRAAGVIVPTRRHPSAVCSAIAVATVRAPIAIVVHTVVADLSHRRPQKEIAPKIGTTVQARSDGAVPVIYSCLYGWRGRQSDHRNIFFDSYGYADAHRCKSGCTKSPIGKRLVSVAQTCLDTNRAYINGYEDFVVRDLPVGSGKAESGIRHIIERRMAVAGAWDEGNASFVLASLAILVSGGWDECRLNSSWPGISRWGPPQRHHENYHEGCDR